MLEAIMSLESYGLPPRDGGHLNQPMVLWRDMEAVRSSLKEIQRAVSDAAVVARAAVSGAGVHADVAPPPIPKGLLHGKNN